MTSFESRLIASGYSVFDPQNGALCREDRELHMYTYMEVDPNVWCFQKFDSGNQLLKEVYFQVK